MQNSSSLHTISISEKEFFRNYLSVSWIIREFLDRGAVGLQLKQNDVIYNVTHLCLMYTIHKRPLISRLIKSVEIKSAILHIVYG